MRLLVSASGSVRPSGSVRRTGLAAAAEDHLHVVDGELAPEAVGNLERVELDRYIAYPSARRAHQVMVVVFDVRVDPQRTGAEVEDVHLAERLEVVDGLVDGLQRHRRHVDAGPFVQRFDRRVVGVGIGIALEQAEDHLALRRHPQPAGAEQFGEGARRSS